MEEGPVAGTKASSNGPPGPWTSRRGWVHCECGSVEGTTCFGGEAKVGGPSEAQMDKFQGALKRTCHPPYTV